MTRPSQPPPVERYDGLVRLSEVLDVLRHIRDESYVGSSSYDEMGSAIARVQYAATGHTSERICEVRDCWKPADWQYISEYNNDEGYVRTRACEGHLPETARDREHTVRVRTLDPRAVAQNGPSQGGDDV